MAQGWVLIADIRGARGIQGRPGEPGIPGANAVPTSEAVAAYVRATTSPARIALDELYAPKPAVPGKVMAEGSAEPTVSIRYKSYGAIGYTVLTVHAGGSYRPGLIRKYLDIATASPLVVREHDIEIARDNAGATAIVNSSGLVHISGTPHGEGSNVTMRGAQVVDGVALQDFPSDEYWTGYEGYAVLPDGRMKGYSGVRGESVSDMISDGATMASSFGPILVENGARRDLSDPFWDTANSIISSVNLIGQKPNGDIVMVVAEGKTGTSGGTLADSATIALQEGCQFAISMDRGGSTQCFVGSAAVVASSDRTVNVDIDYNKRLVADYVYTTAPVISPVYGRPVDLYYTASAIKPYVDGREPRVTVGANGRVQFSGQLAPVAGPTFPESGITLVRVPPHARSKTNRSGLIVGNNSVIGKWIFNAGDFLLKLTSTQPGMLYVDLDSVSWTIDA